MVSKMATTSTAWYSQGNVMKRKRFHDVAPSTRAARYCSVGMAWMAARKMMHAKGTLRHTWAPMAALSATKGEAMPVYTMLIPNR